MPGEKKEDITTPPAVTEKKVTIKASINSTKTFECNYKSVKLGDSIKFNVHKNVHYFD